MNKLLVITEGAAIGEAMKRTAPIIGFDEVSYTDHEKALEVFLETEPTHVLIFDCSTRENMKGNQTYRILKASATEEKILPCGFEDVQAEDFVRLPFLLVDLAKILHERR